MAGRTLEDSGRSWRELLSDPVKYRTFLRTTIFGMAAFISVLTLVGFVLVILGLRSWEFLGWFLVIDGIVVVGLYALFGLYFPFMYRVGQRWGERRRLAGRKSRFLDQPVGPRTKIR